MAECPLTALTQLRLLVPIPVFDLQFILSHLPPSVLLLYIPNVFSFSSIPFSSLILPPSFHPPPQYEPYLNNVEAPHLIRCLVGQSTRALIKNKQKTTMVDVATQRWAGRQHVWAYTYMLVLCIWSNYKIHSVCVRMPGQHFHQKQFNYNTHF